MVNNHTKKITEFVNSLKIVYVKVVNNEAQIFLHKVKDILTFKC